MSSMRSAPLTEVERARRATALRVIQGGFARQDAQRAQDDVFAEELRAEKAHLMADWSTLVASYDFAQIAARASRLAEIDRMLHQLGG